MGHADFIKALGGGTAVAERLSSVTGEDVDREAVYKWRKLDRIPWRWRAPLMEIARQEGIKIPNEFLPGVPA